MGAWTPLQRVAVVWGGLMVYLAMAVLERVLTLVFLLNFSIDGPGPSLLWLLAVPTALLYPLGLRRTWPHAPTTLDVLAVATVFLLFVTVLPFPELALAAALLWHLAATPLLFSLVATLRRRAALSVALAIALRLAERAWTDSLPLYATAAGTAVLAVAAVVSLLAWQQARAEVTSRSNRLPSPAPLWAAVFAGMAFLAAPALVWSWHDSWSVGVHLGALAGTAAGGWMAMRGQGAGRLRAWEGSALLVLGATWVVWVPWSAAPGIAVACLGAVLALDSALDRPRHDRMRRHGWTTVAVQVAAMVALLLKAIAGNWAFVPGGELLKGHAGPIWFLVPLLLALSVMRRSDFARGSPE